MSVSVPAIAPWPARPLEGHVVLVTGGGAGVGRGIAQAVLGAGGSVAIADRDPDALAACLADWQVGERALAVTMDVSDGNHVAAGMAQVLAHFGRLDGLVNNAGIADPHLPPLDAASWEDWQRGLSSLHGAFWCSRAALPALRASGRGAVINIASTRAHQSEPHSEGYAAAKGGLLAEASAFVNKERAQEDWADPRSIVWLNEGGMDKIKERQSAGLPAGFSQPWRRPGRRTRRRRRWHGRHTSAMARRPCRRPCPGLRSAPRGCSRA